MRPRAQRSNTSNGSSIFFIANPLTNTLNRTIVYRLEWNARLSSEIYLRCMLYVLQTQIAQANRKKIARDLYDRTRVVLWLLFSVLSNVCAGSTRKQLMYVFTECRILFDRRTESLHREPETSIYRNQTARLGVNFMLKPFSHKQ